MKIISEPPLLSCHGDFDDWSNELLTLFFNNKIITLNFSNTLYIYDEDFYCVQ